MRMRAGHTGRLLGLPPATAARREKSKKDKSREKRATKFTVPHSCPMLRTRVFIVWEINELTGEQGTWPEGVMSKLLHPPQLLLLGLMIDGTSCSLLQEAPLAGGTGEGHLVHLLESPTRCWTSCIWSRVQTEGRQPCILIPALLLATWPWEGHCLLWVSIS